MKRELPTWNIEGTEFIVDIKQNELRQMDNDKNTIAFDQMEYKGTHYTMVYDKNEKNKPYSSHYDEENWIDITVPQKVDLDPVSMSEKYGVDLEQVNNKTDFEIIVDQEMYSNRINGCLPSINIAGTKYIIDLRLKELRATDNLLNRIDLRMLQTNDDGNYFFFFRPESGTVVEINPKMTTLPEDLVMIEVPNELKLDPYWAAEEYELNEEDLLMKFPLQEKLEAKVVPISKAGLVDVVQKNRQELLRKDPDKAKSNNKNKHL